MTEKTMYKELKDAWGKAFFFQRFETGLTAKGIPDVYYMTSPGAFSVPGVISGWIELKVGRKTPLGIQIKYRPRQQYQLEALKKASGNAFTLFWYNNNYYLTTDFSTEFPIDFVWVGDTLKDFSLFHILRGELNGNK